MEILDKVEQLKVELNHLRTRMWLHIGMIGPKNLLCAHHSQIHDHIGKLAPAAILLARIALVIFVGKNRPAAYSTASETKFSDPINSNPSASRRTSSSIA